MRASRWVWLALLAGVLSFACAPYSVKRRPLVDAMASGEWQAAENTLGKLASHPPNLLDLLDRATLLHMQGLYADSNAAFQDAEDLARDLDTVSISREAATYLVNDLTQAYPGESFERSWIHVLRAFNYIGLGDLESARVEARKIDLALQLSADSDSDRRGYRTHAFGHYLSGLLHQAQGNWNDARVSYLKSLEAYGAAEKRREGKTPLSLRHDLVCASFSLGLSQEVQQFRSAYIQAGGNSQDLTCSKGESFLFVLLGKIAHKEEVSEGVEAFPGPILKIAYPVYEETPFVWTQVSVQAGSKTFSAEKVDDLSRLAAGMLADRLSLIRAKALARAAAKAGASAAAGVAVARETDDAALGFLVAYLVNSLLGYTERADTRSWLTLPSEVHLVRLPASVSSRTDLRVLLQGQGASQVVPLKLPLTSDGETLSFQFFRALEPR